MIRVEKSDNFSFAHVILTTKHKFPIASPFFLSLSLHLDGHNKNSPDSGYQNDDSNLLEHKAFYENLPFHGINAPGKKVCLAMN